MQAPMLYRGEKIGGAVGPRMDIAVDPLDGTTLTAQGRNGAISVSLFACCRHDGLPCFPSLHFSSTSMLKL